MWRPRSWDEIRLLLGQAEETAALDFKRELTTNNRELAKDIAAMTINGGVLIYGIDEDPDTGRATAAPGIALAGCEERIRQVAGTRIAPAPEVEIELLRDPANEDQGVVLVVVPASPVAPHQVDGRYPCRRGTTTSSLVEAEVERLYIQRERLLKPPPAPEELLQDFSVFQEQGDGRIGSLQLVVAPRTQEVSHAAGPWQGPQLHGAVYRAVQRQHPRFANISLARSFNALSDWRPLGSIGWATGRDAPSPSGLADSQRFGSILDYPGRLSFAAQWGLAMERDGSNLVCARELDIARELTAMLAIAGEYFSTVNGGGLLFAALRLAGFEGALSQLALERGLRAGLPDAPAGVTGDAATSAIELRDEPEIVARRLIERWLPAFYMVDGVQLDRRGASGDPLDPFELIVPAIGPR